MDFQTGSFPILRDFLHYCEAIRGLSRRTVDEYFLDLRLFFRYILKIKQNLPPDTGWDDISIASVDLPFIRTITLSDVYSYMSFLTRTRPNQPNSARSALGIGAAARARKVASIRSFYKYLTVKTKQLSENPMQDLDSPKLKKSLPRFLSLQDSLRLLDAVKGPNAARDYCILTLFLNCGLRISELVGLNVADVREDHLRVTGKGNKERLVFLNQACVQALADYLQVRRPPTVGSEGDLEPALFLSRLKRRMSTQAVHLMVKNTLLAAGLPAGQYSSHKLRHTAATLMLQHGVDVRTLQEVLGHEHLNTTQIYTHVENTQLKEAALANPLGRVERKSK